MIKKISKKVFAVLIAMLVLLTGAVITSNAADNQSFYITNATGTAGDEVTVTLNCSGNPGISGWSVFVSYNSEVLELVSADKEGVFGTVTVSQNITENPYNISWQGGTVIKSVNGKMAGLTFKIKDNAIPGDYELSISYDADEVYRNVGEEGDTENIPFEPQPGSITVKGSEPVHTHSLTKVAAKAATCTEDGNKEYFVCDGCSKWFEDEAAATEITDHDSVIIKAAHTPSDWIVDKEATESEKGSKHKECTVCGEILEKAEIPVIKPTEPPTDKPTDDPTKPTDDPTKPTDKPTQPGTKTTTGTSSVQSTPKSNGKSGVVNTGDGSLVFLFAVVMIGGCVSAYLINNYRKKKTSK